MDTEQSKTRFYVEAAVGIAKSSMFLTTAEDQVVRGEFMSATISAYYAIFHLSLALMWLFADQLPEKIMSIISDLRDKGNELPSSNITHSSVEKFLCDGQLKLSNTKVLCKLFRRAQELREFGNYGPRVTWSGKNPVVGPCHLSIGDVKALVNEIRPAFIETMRIAGPKTALDGTLGRIVLDQSIEIMTRPAFPFLNWTTPQIYKEALDLLKTVHTELLAPK